MPKTGYVALLGRPNVGKSTILNRLVGQKIAIVSEKPQTTRNRILGIRTESDSQVLFVDTPGIHRPEYRLNKRMMEDVYESMKDVDLLVQVVDVSESYGKGEEYVLSLVKQSGKPTILVLNKIDLVNRGKVLPIIEFYSRECEYQAVIPLSATKGDNVPALEKEIVENLPEGDFLYPPEYLTNLHERFLVSEIVREKVLHHTRKELPYCSAVLVEEFDEDDREDGFVRISASIIVEKEGQKKIVVGRAGRMIRQIGTEARPEIQELLVVPKIYLALNVKVIPNWRNRDTMLDQLGVRSGKYTEPMIN